MAEERAPEARPGHIISGHGEPEDRLEAALDRIAEVLAAPDPVALEVAERLDRMIASLRQALAK